MEEEEEADEGIAAGRVEEKRCSELERREYEAVGMVGQRPARRPFL